MSLTGNWFSPQIYPTPETPAGLVNGSNRTFTLAHPPLPKSVMLFLNGLFMTYGTDYTVTEGTATITMAVAPTGGDKLRVQYLR
jgi:hypothetical protein